MSYKQQMKPIKTIKRIIPHFLFWGVLMLLFTFQNQDANLVDVLNWGLMLMIVGAVSYFNMYVLMPKYFFKKKYLVYFVFLFAAVNVGSILIQFFFPDATKGTDLDPYIQNISNIIFFLLITSGLKFSREYFKKQILIREIENKQLKTELSLLKAQVNPHFLFNTLNNLYGLITAEKTKQAAEVTLRLSDLMRYLLESSKEEKVSLRKEIKFLQDYIELEKIRLPREAVVEFTQKGTEDDLIVAPLLFIPLVENTFKHGFGKRNPNPIAQFSLTVQGNEIYFECENTFYEDETDEKTRSETGLKNLKKRLNIIYPEHHILEISASNNIYKIILNITL